MGGERAIKQILTPGENEAADPLIEIGDKMRERR